MSIYEQTKRREVPASIDHLQRLYLISYTRAVSSVGACRTRISSVARVYTEREEGGERRGRGEVVSASNKLRLTTLLPFFSLFLFSGRVASPRPTRHRTQRFLFPVVLVFLSLVPSLFSSARPFTRNRGCTQAVAWRAS